MLKIYDKHCLKKQRQKNENTYKVSTSTQHMSKNWEAYHGKHLLERYNTWINMNTCERKNSMIRTEHRSNKWKAQQLQL